MTDILPTDSPCIQVLRPDGDRHRLLLGMAEHGVCACECMRVCACSEACSYLFAWVPCASMCSLQLLVIFTHNPNVLLADVDRFRQVKSSFCSVRLQTIKSWMRTPARTHTHTQAHTHARSLLRFLHNQVVKDTNEQMTFNRIQSMRNLVLGHW